MIYCLDTSIAIKLLREHPPTVKRFQSLGHSTIYITLITVGEMEVGFSFDEQGMGREKRKRFNKFLEQTAGIWNTSRKVALEFGRIKAQLKKKNQIIGDNDTWIAAICKVNNAVLVTTNMEHFRRVDGLKIL